MKRRRWLAIPACLAVVSTISLSAAAATTTAPPARAPSAAAESSPRSVTLITGDVVELLDDGNLLVRPGNGRERTGFLLQRQGGHQLVIPGDAVGLLSAGRLDRRLFDVTTLVDAGYDDARRDNIPLIVRYGGPSARAGARNWVTQHSAKVTGEAQAVNMLSTRTAKRDAAGWWADLTSTTHNAGAGKKRTLAGGIESISLDGKPSVPRSREAGLEPETLSLRASSEFLCREFE